MKGMTLFEAMNDLPDDMLLEAAIPAGERRAHRRDRRDARDFRESMTRISGNTYVALAIGFLAAICLLSFIIIAGRPASDAGRQPSDPSYGYPDTGKDTDFPATEGSFPVTAPETETTVAEEDTIRAECDTLPDDVSLCIVLGGQAIYDAMVFDQEVEMYIDKDGAWVCTDCIPTAARLPEYADSMTVYQLSSSSLYGYVITGDVAFNGVTVYDADFQEFTASHGDFSCLENLTPGTWYIAVSTLKTGRWIDGQYERFFYDYVIKVVVVE
ncbi:MAG: hypothetical protein ACI4WV_05380 [Eubacteriales bacterium]